MAEYKRRIELFSLYDHTNIEKHLEKMAAKGWFLEKILTNGPWIYRRDEPKKVHYAVARARTHIATGPSQRRIRTTTQIMCAPPAIQGWTA